MKNEIVGIELTEENTSNGMCEDVAMYKMVIESNNTDELYVMCSSKKASLFKWATNILNDIASNDPNDLEQTYVSLFDKGENRIDTTTKKQVCADDLDVIRTFDFSTLE